MTTLALNLIDPTPTFSLPVSAGGAVVVNFQQVDPGDESTFVDYGVGVSVTLTIDTTPPIVAEAVVSGHDAVVRVEADSTSAVAMPRGTLWRVVVTTPGDPPTPIVGANGTVARYDGK